MKAIQVQTIDFLITKGGHQAAIINNAYTVVKNTEKDPVYTVYPNVAKGANNEGSEDKKEEFTTAFLNHFIEIERKEAETRKLAQKIESARIKEIEDTVKGMTPQEVAEFYNLYTCETAGHWNDLYTGSSSFAIQISSNEENEIIEIAESVNNWGGEFGELKNRAGEHHHIFSDCYDLKNYQNNCQTYFSEKYNFRSQETDEYFYFSTLSDMIYDGLSTMEEAFEWVKEWENIETGYYSGDEMVFEGDDFSKFFGYSQDVYYYNFGYRLPSKDVFYNGIEEDEDEENED